MILSRRVLVLNRLWQPVNIIGMRRAVALVFIGQASVLLRQDGGGSAMNLEQWISFSQKHPPERGLSAAKVSLHAPEVILLSGYEKPPRHEVRFSRRHVLQRDGFSCQYCGRHCDEAELNLDHVVPRERGGRTTWENIVTACLRCNAHKADRLPHQAGMRLAKAPSRPSWRSFAARSFSETERAAWAEYWPVDTRRPPAVPAVFESGTGSQNRTDVICVEGRGPTAERYPHTV